jgi:lactate racemase-like protein
VKIPLLAGSRIAVVNTPDDAVILRPPPPGEPVADVGAAVRDALRFPLAGDPLETIVTPGGTATIVVEHPSLPLPSAVHDPRQEALAATADELERLGIPSERQTLLVAGGLERRASRRGLDRLVAPEFARRFRGQLAIHDAEDPDLIEIGNLDGMSLRVNKALLQTDAVICVSAAESVLHGGPAVLLAGSGAEALREAGGHSLLEVSASRGWDLALVLERALSERVRLLGISLVLDQPRLGGVLRGFPHEEGSLERVARSPLRLAFRALPDFARRQVLQSLPIDLNVTAAYAGPPSVAHAEALLRAIDARSTSLDGKLDAICIGIPATTAHLPREQSNPLLAAYLGLGIALRMWRSEFPLADGGTAILVHHFHRRFGHGTQHPYRAFFRAARDGIEPERLAAAEAAATGDERAVAAYREGRSCHPALPFVDWRGCVPALDRLGAVLVAGCRDAAAARRLGFVPTHGIGAALEMAHGRAGGPPRIGFLPSPPYFPLQVVGAPSEL